jgi:peptidoglycan hydrolase-like protein with peptidoglycan-binding domain
MSYNGTNGLGCVGGCAGGCGCSGMGAYFPNQRRRGGLRGFGSMAGTFNAAAVWADVLAGSKFVDGKFVGDNAAGSRAAKAVQAGLSELGYACPPTGSFDNATIAQWKSFKSKNGLPPGTGNVQQDGLILMEAQLKAGKVTGPDEPIKYVPGEGGSYIPEESLGTKKAGIGMGMMLLLGAVVVGGVILYAKKKKGQGSTTMRTGRSGTGRDMDSYGGSSGLYASVKE